MAIAKISPQSLLAWGWVLLRPVASSPVAAGTAAAEPPLLEGQTPAATCPSAGYTATTTRDALWNVPEATTTIEWGVEYYNNSPLGGKYEETYMVVKTTLNEDPATATAYPHVFRRTRASKYVTVVTYTDMMDGACRTVGQGLDSKTVTDTYTAFATDPARYMDASATDFADGPCPGVVPGEGEGDEEERQQHEDCVALGMDTACIGQCGLGGRDGALFICPENTYNQVPDLSMGLGRVCWATNGTMHALHSPCLVGDHGVGCIPGKADHRPFRPGKWV